MQVSVEKLQNTSFLVRVLSTKPFFKKDHKQLDDYIVDYITFSIHYNCKMEPEMSTLL